MKGGSFGVGNQVLIPSHCKLVPPNVMALGCQILDHGLLEYAMAEVRASFGPLRSWRPLSFPRSSRGLLFAEALKLAQFTRRRSGADRTGCYLAERGAANDAPSAIYRGNEMIATQVRKLPDSVRGQ